MATLQTFGPNRYLLEALNTYAVEYLVVGGVAVKYYVSDRVIDDLDLLINSTVQNAERCIAALSTLNLLINFCAADLARPKVQIPLKTIHYADLVTPGIQFDFAKALASSRHGTVNSVETRIVSREDLIELKQGHREKDRSDVQLLKSHA